jgi:hypothetical protein
MKQLIVLAALAFALGTAHQASACDYGAHAANATPIVVATTEQPTTQPKATEPATPTVATDKPLTPPVVADPGGRLHRLRLLSSFLIAPSWLLPQRSPSGDRTP